MRLTTLCLAVLTLLSPLSAAGVRVNIPLENLSISQEGIFFLTDQGETIPLQQLCHDHHGYYTTCHLSLKRGAQLFYQGASPQMITFLSQLLTDPETYEQLALEIEYAFDGWGDGDTDNWNAGGSLTFGESDSKWDFSVFGEVDHSSSGETDFQVGGEITYSY